jgi:cysteine-rich repeat protein
VEVVIEVERDDSVREKMGALHLEVWSAGTDLSCSEAQCWSKRLSRDYTANLQTWPVRFSVVPLGGDTQRVFEVIAQALDDAGNVLLEQRAVSGFVAGGSVKLALSLGKLCIDLAGECLANGNCHGPLCSTCREGRCEPTGLLQANAAGQLEPSALDAALATPEAGMDATSDEPDVPDVGSDAGGIETEAALPSAKPTPGAACAQSDALGCQGVAQRERLRCSLGVWTSNGTCKADENCAQASGTCAPIVPGCLDHPAGTPFCAANGALTTCGADLVSAETMLCSGKCTTLPASALCAPMTCVDGKTQAPEECDDGNDSDSDACTTACTKARCGDGAPWTDHEECDDGNEVDGDSCVSCKLARCGDSKTWTGMEECDDGNAEDGDACARCKPARCGDGFVRAGVEACDDGNANDADGCSNHCKVNDGGSCNANQDCVSSACVAKKCVAKPALNGACDDSEDCSNTSAPGCTNGICACDKTTCGSACVDLSVHSSHCGDCGHSCLGGGCLAGACRPIVLATGQASPLRVAVNASGVFWTNTGDGSVMKAGLDGSGITPLATGQNRPYGIAVDADYVYYVFAAAMPDYGTVRKVSIAGGTPVDLLKGVYEPREIAIDANNVYAAGYERGLIQASLTPGGAAVFLFSGYGPWAVAVSSQSGQIYWTNVDLMGVQRASVGGTASTLTMGQSANESGGRRSIAISGSTLYFTTKDSVQSISVFGGSLTPIATGQATPHAVAADATGVYWTNEATAGTVMRGSPAGVQTLATGQDKPLGIALDAKAVYWVNSGSGQVMKVAK